MRTLTVSEQNEVSGGVLQFVLGVIAGMTANYVYEKAGGAKGIDAALAGAATKGHPFNSESGSRFSPF